MIRAQERSSRFLVAAAAVALVSAAACSDAEPAKPAEAQAVDVAADDRVAWLFAGCTPGGPYDVETGDTTAVLVETLVSGQRDPLKRARAELALDASDGFERTMRLFERYVSDPIGMAYVLNALDVALLSEDPRARDMLVRALAHPAEVVRTQAVRGLARHGLPEDFDLVLERVAHAQFAELDAAVAALPRIDRERAEQEIARWLAQGAMTDRLELIPGVVASARTDELREACREGWRTAPAGLAPYMLVALSTATGGSDTEIEAALAERRAHPDAGVRSRTLDALAAAERWDDLARALGEERDPFVRLRAVSALIEADQVAAHRDAIAVLLDDPSVDLRALALRALVDAGDPEARDRALALLARPDPDERDAGLAALGGSLEREPALAARAFDVAIELWRAQSDRDLRTGQSVLRTLSGIPDPRAAELFVELAEASSGRLENGMRTHRWLALQAARAGAAGASALAGALERERDPLRRLDLLEALSAPGGDGVRTRLLELALDPDSDPLEVVYAASRLVHVGPARIVLPALKRASFQVTDPPARAALWCLLWHWYPRPAPGR